MSGKTKNILVFSRMYITNYGDPIIADCCKYIIEKTAKENNVPVNVIEANVYEEDNQVLENLIKDQDAVVFPGGGMNSVVYNENVLRIYSILEKYPNIEIYFNAIGILRINPREKNEIFLRKIFNHPQVAQVTTRGDFPQLTKYLAKEFKYPPKWVIDPAVWTNEAFHAQRNPKAKKIGIGVIRPDIFECNKNVFSEDDVMDMYIGIIRELERRGYKWELFTNGMNKDYIFGMEICKRVHRWAKLALHRNILSSEQLIQRVGKYKGIIAARMHANIIATSLDVPSVGLVWNDKMNLFAQTIGHEERYIPVEKLLDSKLIVDQLEHAMADGYDREKINSMKEVTEETIKNIIK